MELSYESRLKKHGGAIQDLKEVINKESKVKIKRGQLIINRYIQEVPEVRIGDEIIIVLKQKGVQLKVKGKALGKGLTGDQIRVKVLIGKPKILKGEVIGKKMVQIL